MVLEGIANTARSLSCLMRQQEVVANNLANTGTDAFKATKLAAWMSTGGRHPVPVERTDLQQGALRDTGRALDLALEGPGFLVVQTARGERLFRGGSLRLDGAGRLVDPSGDPVLGKDGPLVLTGASIEVQPDGSVLNDGANAGTLRIETLDDPEVALRKEEAGLFVALAPTRAASAADVRVRQRSIEEPNMDPLLSLVNLVAIQRAYGASTDALKAMDSILGTVAGEVGKV